MTATAPMTTVLLDPKPTPKPNPNLKPNPNAVPVPPPPRRRSCEEPSGCGKFVNITEGMTTENIDYAKLCSSLWSYMRNYSPDGPRPQYKPEIILKLLERSKEALKKDAMIVKVNGPVVLFGPLYGEGDSMITLMSLAKAMPPDVTYVFLGCYIGNGFAQLECFFYVLSLKLLHPNKVVLLKGHHEESVSMELLKLKDWLYARGVTQTVHIEEIIVEMKRTGNFMSAGSILNGKILCMPGGPGPCLRERGLKALAALKKGMQEVPDKKMIMEAAWSVLLLNESQKDSHGMPFFTQLQATEFCKKHNFKCMIRGRQMVDHGFLNKPKEVITLISAVAYLDNFRNYAAAISISKNKGRVVRYKMEEGEQLSLELVKPGIGRNAML